MKTDLKKPQRFISEYSEQDAEMLAERLLDCPKFKQDLIDFLTGFADTQEISYSIQLRVENEEDHLEEMAREEARRGA